MAIVLGADAIKGEFSSRSASAAPDSRTLAGIRSHALSAFQTPGQDHRFIVAPSLRLSGGTDRDCLLFAVYAVDAEAVERWVEKGHVAGIDAAFDRHGFILNAGEADIFTHLNDAERAATARNNAALQTQREQLRLLAHRGTDGGAFGSAEWNNEVLADRYKDLEAAPAPFRAARSLTRRLLGVAAAAKPAP